MAYSVVTSTIKQAATTDAIDTTGADLIVVVVNSGLGVGTGLSDSKSNTWTALTAQGIGGSNERIFYCAAPTVGSGHTLTFTGGTRPALAVIAASGAHASPFDQQNGNAASDAGTTIQPGSVTPTTDNQLVVVGFAAEDALANGFCDPSTINGSFTIQHHLATTGNVLGTGIAYLIQTTAAAANPQWTATDPSVGTWRKSACIATFKAAGAAPAAPFTRNLMVNQAVNRVGTY